VEPKKPSMMSHAPTMALRWSFDISVSVIHHIAILVRNFSEPLSVIRQDKHASINAIKEAGG
jgi:hypothetical protein